MNLFPSKGDRLIVPSGCNTAAPELHLRPAVAKRPSTLDAVPGSAHPTSLAKVNAFPPANSYHSPYDCLRLSPLHYSWLSRFVFFFYWFVTSLSNAVVFTLILMHQLRLFAFLYFLLDFSWVSYVTSMPRRPLNHQLNNNNNKCIY